jgi:small basic protein
MGFSASLLAWLAVVVAIVVGAPFHTSLPDDALPMAALALGVTLDPVVVRAMLDAAAALGIAFELDT